MALRKGSLLFIDGQTCQLTADPRRDGAGWQVTYRTEVGGKTTTAYATDEELDPSQASYSWEEMANLDHESQVATFGWCTCEQGEKMYDDCPVEVTA